MEIREDSTLARVKVNMLSRVVTLIGDDGELIDVENNNSEEFINMCSFINETLSEEMIEYTYWYPERNSTFHYKKVGQKIPGQNRSRPFLLEFNENNVTLRIGYWNVRRKPYKYWNFVALKPINTS